MRSTLLKAIVVGLFGAFPAFAHPNLLRSQTGRDQNGADRRNKKHFHMIDGLSFEFPGY